MSGLTWAEDTYTVRSIFVGVDGDAMPDGGVEMLCEMLLKNFL